MRPFAYFAADSSAPCRACIRSRSWNVRIAFGHRRSLQVKTSWLSDFPFAEIDPANLRIICGHGWHMRENTSYNLRIQCVE
jgi:hypothetical protein